MPLSKRSMLSERKIENYLHYAKIIQYGRANPLWFIETFMGLE